MLITLLVFIFILGLLIFVHELGHFWAAKRLGVKVHEFAFGFKPRLFAWKRGETEYAINLLPFGGYVRLEGENENTESASRQKGSFAAQPPSRRAVILVAGVVMNLLLAWLLFTGAYIVGSYPLTTSFDKHEGINPSAQVIVIDVNPNSPASLAGLQAGDTLVAVNGERVTGATFLMEAIKQNIDTETTLTYVRDNKETQVKIVPRSNPPQGQGALGISLGESAVVKVPWYKAPVIGLQEVGSQIKAAFVGFMEFLAKLFFRQEVDQNVSGIVGVGAATGVIRRLGIGPLMQFIALISTNLAVINILPILPLDGGHLLFVILEAIRKKPIADRYRQAVGLAGLIVILGLFVLVTYNDVLRFSLFDRLTNLF